MKEVIPKMTKCQTARMERDLAIFNEYNKLASVSGQSKTEVNKYLMQKYNVSSEGTIYVIRKRVEKRLKKEEGQV